MASRGKFASEWGMKYVIVGILMFGLGVALGQFLAILKDTPVDLPTDGFTPIAVEPEEQRVDQSKQLADMRRRLSGSESANLELRNEVAELKLALEQAEGKAAAAAPDPAEQWQRRIDSRLVSRAERMAGTYGLNDEQTTALTGVLRAQMENFMALRRGNAVEPFNLDDALQEVLTAEQFAEYVDSTQEEIYERADRISAVQLVRLAREVGLEPAQQDLVYDTYNTTTQEYLIARQTGESYDIEARLEERLSQILSPEQMQAVQEQGGVSIRGEGGGMGRGGNGP